MITAGFWKAVEMMCQRNGEQLGRLGKRLAGKDALAQGDRGQGPPAGDGQTLLLVSWQAGRCVNLCGSQPPPPQNGYEKEYLPHQVWIKGANTERFSCKNPKSKVFFFKP